MSVLDRFEKSVEGAVNGVFAKFGSKDLQPVDLSSALEREIDAEAMPVGRDRTVAPNEYRFKLSTPDFDRIEAWGSETLANELADNLTEYAKSQHYAFVGPVIVIFEEDLDLSKGNFNLTSESVQGNAVPVTTDAQTEDSPVLEVNGNQYLLTKDKTVIGRGSGCDIVIDDPGISRKHLEIDITDNGVIARDLGSTNGTYVEGHQVPAATLLDGNTITIGAAGVRLTSQSAKQEQNITSIEDDLLGQTSKIEVITGKVDQINAQKMYRTELVVDGVNIFRDKGQRSILRCRVYSWDKEITDTLPASSFVWHRNSGREDLDADWDSSHKGMKSITVTTEDVTDNASFYCEITI